MILYNQIKSKIYKSIPKHSAYRSGIIVKQYKKSYKKNMERIIPILVSVRKKKVYLDGLQKNG
jgi:hypothetical protein